MPLPIYVLRNGELVLPAQATISVFNPAIYGAFGVYESMQVANGVVFAQRHHLERLARSAAWLGLKLPADFALLERWIADVLRANAVSDATLRLFVVGGDDEAESVVFIWPQPPTRFPERFYREGADAITFEGERYLPQAKTLNTLVTYLARRRAQAAAVHEALLYHDGYLTEGSNSNLFVVLRGEVLTPPADQVLAGVTRDLLIALAAQHGLPIRETPLALADLPQWEECFITSTSRHVMPVTAVDGRPVGAGRVGPLTQRLAAIFEAYFCEQCLLHRCV
ncbi:MAG: aminotransferase class IV [Anaerolineae bacterium]|nr:aminotransferase class IV [Anaerolineae bacterium]